MTARCPTLQDCMKAKRNKYRNVRTPYNGRVYDSAKEAAYARELDLRKAAGDILDWTPQYAVPLIVNGVTVATYRADFRVILPDGREELIDVKGAPPTAVFKLKAKLVAALYPNRELRVIR